MTRAADISKQQYDRKARAADVAVADLVLVRNVTMREKQIVDRWEEDPYVVLGKPFHDQPVFDVKMDRPNARKTRPSASESPLTKRYVIPQRRNDDSLESDTEDHEQHPVRRSSKQCRPAGRFETLDWRQKRR